MVRHTETEDRKVCVGVIAGPHGVNGLVRLKSYTADPAAVAAYGPLSDAVGARRFRIKLAGTARDMLLARIDGVADRTAAEALRGVELYVARDRLPATEADEFYHADLIGLSAQSMDGGDLGTVTALYDYGAGDMIEIRAADGGAALLPFTKAVVREVDLQRGVVVIDPPAEVYVRPDEARVEAEL